MQTDTMHGINPIDEGREIDWGKTSEDYAAFRPGPPDSFYTRLRALGVGLPGQRILDLGTGTGVLARHFAKGGAVAAGVDISEGQIETARRLAQSDGLDVDFGVASAEATGFAAKSFDIVCANQCWLYFDNEKAIAEVKRLLDTGSVLVTAHNCWLPREDKVARKSEQLVLKYNPQWTASHWSGDVPAIPDWAAGHFRLVGMFCYDEPIPFTRESWRGRIRACRGVGATLSEDEIARLDAEHAKILEEHVAESFTILHRIDAHILKPL